MTEVADDVQLVRGDPKGVTELLTNLLGNAIRYSPEGSAVEVGISACDDCVEITVADHGIGINDADQPRIFEEFYRAGNARDFAPDGTGLGLTIVKSVVDAHGGTIAVKSRKGQGTTFTVRLPLRQPESVKTQAS
jgi:two-component system sensor histidine kinase SenX3